MSDTTKGTRPGDPDSDQRVGQSAFTATEVVTPVGDEIEPVGRRASLWSDAWRQLRRDPLFLISALIITVFTLMAVFPQLFAFGTDPRFADLSNTVRRPCWLDACEGEGALAYPFGWDVLGRDYFARVIYGARVSISVGVIVTAGALFIALLFGSAAGYYAGRVDGVLSRIADIWLAIPITLAGIAILNVLPNRGVGQLSIVLIAFGWPTMMRIARSAAISEKERDYVSAARALGASDLRIITRHILPNSVAPVIVYATIFVGIIIAAEATLSFLGVGLQAPAISWGLMINEASRRVINTPHLLLFPGVFLALTVFGFILMGDALRDALDPKLR